MNQYKTNKKLLAILLSICMLMGMAVPAMAEGEPITKGGGITAFDELPEDIRWQNTMEPEFPETVRGVVNEEATEIPVTWQADHPYNSEAPERGLYVFSAVLGEEFTCGENTEIPLLTVYIPETAGRFSQMSMGGDGTSEKPLEIATAAQLREVAVLVNIKQDGLPLFLFNDVSKTVSIKLMNDIDLSAYGKNFDGGKGWKPIGGGLTSFKDNFDGDGHKITGLYINRSNEDRVGLFGDVRSSNEIQTQIQNLGIVDAEVTGKDMTGILAGGLNGKNAAKNCYTSGEVSSDSDVVGGLAGEIYAKIENCYSTATVSGSDEIGGIAGRINMGTIERCYFTGIVSGTNMVGGIAGNAYGTVKNCYSAGSVTGQTEVGGIAGLHTYGTIENCYSVAIVEGTDIVGGIVGHIEDYTTLNAHGTVNNCIALNPSVTATDAGGAVGRVAGEKDEGCTLSGNYAFGGMAVTVNDAPQTIEDAADKVDGISNSAAGIGTVNFFQTLFGSGTAWIYTEGGLPILKNSEGDGAMPGQDAGFPPHIVDGGDSQYFPGAGIEGNPYQISTPAQLAKLAELVNSSEINVYDAYNTKCYKLMNDIDLSAYGKHFDEGKGWIPIGSGSAPFKGSFDGGEHKITGLYINRSDDARIGLFGQVFSPAIIQNLGIVDAEVTGKESVGILAGTLNSTNIVVDNCYTSGMVSSNYYTGGLAGDSYAQIKNCYSTATVSGTEKVGGIAGNAYGTVKDCYSAGSVTGQTAVGGIAGRHTGGTIENCYSVAAVKGTDKVGGIVGYMEKTVSTYSTVKNCIALNPSVTATDAGGAAGRVAGYKDLGCNLSGNYAFDGIAVTVNDEPQTIEDGAANNINGAPKTAAELQTEDGFPDTSAAGDIFNAAPWTYAAGELPILKNSEDDEAMPGQDASLPSHISGNYFAGGDGLSADTAYQISTAAQLAKLAELVNSGETNGEYGAAYYMLTNDIDLSAYGKDWNDGKGWIPIGERNHPFSGSFDGNGKTISGLYINRPEESYQGLFGYVSCNDLEIKNFTLKNVDITGKAKTGGIAGEARFVTIRGVRVNGSVQGANYVGGVVGDGKNNLLIENCIADIRVEATGKGESYSYAGGLAGNCIPGNVGNKTTVISSFVTGQVVGNSGSIKGYTGGIVGYLAGGEMLDCYSEANITGTGNNSISGGIAGSIEGSTAILTRVENCYSTGIVSGKTVGGIVGYLQDSGGVTEKSTVRNSAALNPSVTAQSGGNAGRVAGKKDEGNTLSNNYGFSGMTVSVNGNPKTISDANNKDGLDGMNASSSSINSAAFWTTDGNWDTAEGKVWDSTVWTFEDGKLPILQEPPESAQSGDGGLYLLERNIANATVMVDGAPFTYTGSSLIPGDLTVSFDGQTLKKDTDYTFAIESYSQSKGTEAGTVTLTLAGIGNFTGNKDIVFTINKATPTKEDLEYNLDSISYSRATSIGMIWDGVSVTAKNFFNDMGTITVNYNGNPVKPARAGTYAITVDIAGNNNYNAVTGLSLGDFIITLSPITIDSTSSTVTQKIFDGSTDAEVNIVFKDENNSPLVPPLMKGTDYTVTNAQFNSLNVKEANTVTATITLIGEAANNWTLEDDDFSKAASILQASSPTISNQSITQKYTVTTPKSKSLAGLMPANAGALTYVKGTAQTTGDAIVLNWDVDDNGLVTYTITIATTSDSITLPVNIKSDNYGDTKVNIVITITDKDVPEANANNITVTYTGTKLENSAITGTAVFEGNPVAGEWSFVTDTEDLIDAAVYTGVTVKFTPTDTLNYASVEKPITVTVNKADPVGTPSHKPITQPGKTLADAELNLGTITPGGTIAWDLAETTVINTNTTYNWTFTPTDAENYNTLTGSIKLYSVSTGGGGGGAAPPKYTADVKITDEEGKDIGKQPLPITVDKSTGIARLDMSAQTGLMEDGGVIVVTIPSIPDVDSYIIALPGSNLSDKDSGGALEVKTEKGSVTIPSDMLSNVPGADKGKAEIAIGEGDKSGLPDEVRSIIGDRPLVQLTLSLDGKRVEWNNPDAPVTVSIPYKPTARELENPESIIVWYIDGSGKAVSVPNGRYDAKSGTVIFTTTHFSYYAVGYNGITYTDVPQNAWYYKAISFIAARNITSGTGGGRFSPEINLTRGQFITLLLKAFEIGADESPAGNFADAGNTYYTGYLAAAKRLGISSGTGNNMFSPNNEITRQEMFTMLFRALKAIGKLPEKTEDDSGNDLSDFTDNAAIAPYAKEAMEYLIKTGVINGSGGKLVPDGKTTRAQMAQVLYNLMAE